METVLDGVMHSSLGWRTVGSIHLCRRCCRHDLRKRAEETGGCVGHTAAAVAWDNEPAASMGHSQNIPDHNRCSALHEDP